MEENKYYTPEIDEFFVGFEYEEQYNEKTVFHKNVVNADTCDYPDYDELGHLKWKCECSQVRVKYLDKQDLVELGFEYIEEVGDCVNFARYIQDSNQSINLTLHNNSHRVGIALHDLNVKSPMTSIQIGTFGGEIKNKSELIKVLKMLGIK